MTTLITILFIFVSCIWVLSLLLKNSSIIDIFWSLGFLLILAIALNERTDQFTSPIFLFSFLIVFWAIRLSSYLLIRFLGKEEDKRYQVFRKQSGKHYWWVSYFKVFLLQGILMLILGYPIYHFILNHSENSLNFFHLAGSLLMIAGLIFESWADYSLMLFKSKPENKGKLYTKGPFAYSRHPNYFGESLFWWGAYVFYLSSPLGYLMFYSPLLLTVLLLKVSGVSLMEKYMKVEKKGYEDYMKKTPAFIPSFRKPS